MEIKKLANTTLNFIIRRFIVEIVLAKCWNKSRQIDRKKYKIIFEHELNDLHKLNYSLSR